MKSLLFAGLLAATLTLPGCLAVSEPVCQSTLLVPVSSVIGPRMAAVNQQVTYTLSYNLGNSCGVFNNLTTNVFSNMDGSTTQQVGVNGSYNGCSCAAVSTAATTAYQFQPTKAGTYYIQFLTTSSQFITDTLIVR